MSTLLIGILLGVAISPLGFDLARTAFARVRGARAVHRSDAPPGVADGRVEEAVYDGLYKHPSSGSVERVAEPSMPPSSARPGPTTTWRRRRKRIPAGTAAEDGREVAA
jgi:hypothetical protein